MTENNQEKNPQILIEPSDLKPYGFTDSGAKKLKETLDDYFKTIFRKSLNLGESDKESGMKREITHTHVKSAALSIAQSYGKGKQTKWQNIAQAMEYIFAAIGGAGASHLDKTPGVIAFVVGAIGSVLCFTYRTFSKGE